MPWLSAIPKRWLIIATIAVATLVVLSAVGVIDWSALGALAAVALGLLGLRRQRGQRAQAIEDLGDLDSIPDASAELADDARDLVHAEADRDREVITDAAEGRGPSPAAVAASRRGRR